VRGLPEVFGALPSAVMAEEMETEGPGQIRAMVCIAGNPVLSTPNGERLARALAGLDLLVSIDLYLNETSRLAHLVLPPTTVLESGNFDLILSSLAVRNVAKYSAPVLAAPEGSRDDWSIAAGLALRLLAGRGIARMFERRIENLPDRIVDWLLRMGDSGLTLEALRAAPHGIDLGPLRPARSEKVRTRDGKVQLAPAPLVADLPRLERWVDAPRSGSLALVGRRHLRSNNSWLHNLPSLVKGPDRSQLLMHPEGARAQPDRRAAGAAGDQRRDDAGRGVAAARLRPRRGGVVAARGGCAARPERQPDHRRAAGGAGDRHLDPQRRAGGGARRGRRRERGGGAIVSEGDTGGFVVGTEYSVTRTFTDEMVRAFTAVSGDAGHHHVEPDSSGRLLVQGLLVATLPTQLGGDLDFLARELDFEFLRPVWTGDAVRCALRIDTVELAPGRVRLTFSGACHNQDGVEVMRARVRGVVLLPRRAR
jgi:acyl dehydratase